tara:strand:+ start:280 stop:492 length:213 start_codon:yes stop_codon:yes gene_type:complete
MIIKNIYLKNNYYYLFSLIIVNLFILKINKPPAWDQAYHLSNIFKMHNILEDIGINITERFNQILNVTDS